MFLAPLKNGYIFFLKVIVWNKDPKDLTPVLPKEVLPSDYDGNLKSLKELSGRYQWNSSYLSAARYYSSQMLSVGNAYRNYLISTSCQSWMHSKIILHLSIVHTVPCQMYTYTSTKMESRDREVLKFSLPLLFLHPPWLPYHVHLFQPYATLALITHRGISR